ncbi:MAG: HPr family phosphocarrier protein [Velocimicrobium sp.]
MKEFKFTITDPQGIHARPAGVLVKAATKIESKVMIEKAGREVDAKRIIGIMGLGAKTGEEITVKIEGVDEEEGYVQLKQFFEDNL